MTRTGKIVKCTVCMTASCSLHLRTRLNFAWPVGVNIDVPVLRMTVGNGRVKAVLKSWRCSGAAKTGLALHAVP